MIRVLYFARLREMLGLPGEEISVSGSISVADLISTLVARGERWQQAFAGGLQLRAAVNQTLAADSTMVHAGDEVAFFPPVTGG